MDPYSQIDGIVAASLTGFTLLTNVVDASHIQVWDREIDVRGDPGDLEEGDLRDRIWIIPLNCQTLSNWSSGSIRFARRYQVGFGSWGLKLESVRAIEYLLTRALVRLHNLTGPDGVTPLVDPTPLSIESVELGATDPQREPAGPADIEGWIDVCEVSVVAFASRADLAAD